MDTVWVRCPECKERATYLKASSNSSLNRYGTPVPITNAQKRLFSLGVTSIEREAEEVWQVLLGEIEDFHAKRKLVLKRLDRFNSDWYLKPSSLRELVKDLELQNNYNTILTQLIKTKRLSDSTVRTCTQRLGFKLFGV